MDKINYKNDVRISRELNHFRGGYTILELDFIYSFISMIDKNDVDLRNYSLSLAELELKMQRRLEIKKIEYLFDSLIKKEFKIDNDQNIKVYTFFTYLTYDKVEKILTVDFNYRLKEHLLQLKEFALGNLQHIFAFKSEYAKRIYMLIVQWKNNIKSKEYSIEELKELLQIPENYLYGEIKRTVLHQTNKELKKNDSDYYFTFTERKLGKRVVAITFFVHKNLKLKQETLNKKNKKSIDYTIYYGIDCFIKGKVCEHLLSITRLEDGSLNCSFRSGEHYCFKNLETLLEFKFNKFISLQKP